MVVNDAEAIALKRMQHGFVQYEQRVVTPEIARLPGV